jgi:RHS repeat-associated protein
VLNSRQTTYHYSDDNNRLEWYTVVATAGSQNGHTFERVEYESEFDGDAAGNVRRVVRKIADPPGPVVDEWDVFATEFFYNRAGEVQVISQRAWHQVDELEGPVITNLVTTSIREFRGNGRTRYMARDRIINPGQPDDLMPDYDTGTWTSYDGDLPTRDVTLNWVTDPAPAHYVGSDVKQYHLGLAQFEPTATVGDYDVNYFHSDHLGTTRAMTDEGAAGPPLVAPTASPRITYTAFGELVSVNGTLGAPPPSDTRYQYVGKAGYETFAEYPYLHVGHRWYDPSTGRFLQGDPMGIKGGINVYIYVRLNPTKWIDPSGQGWRENFAEGVMWITGGDESWMDDDFAVEQMQRQMVTLQPLAM